MKLEDIVLDNNEINPKHILLLSKGGSGKTIQLIRLCKQLLNIFDKTGIFPIYLALNAYNGKRDYITNQIINMFFSNVKAFDNESSIRYVRNNILSNRQYRFILMLDGLNETALDTSALISEINELASLDNLKLIITSRYLINIDMNPFAIYTMEPLSEDIMVDKVYNYTDLNNNLKKLLTLPQYIRIYSETDDETKNEITTEVELFDKYFDSQLKKLKMYAGEKYQTIVRKILYDFMPSFLLENIFNTKKHMVFADSDIVTKWTTYRLENSIAITDKPCTKILQELGIIKRHFDEDFWIFHHETYLEYFINKFYDKKIKIRSIENIESATDIVWYFDNIKHDKKSAYSYGKKLITELDLLKLTEENKLKAAHLYSANGYTILHANKIKDDALEISLRALTKASSLLEDVSCAKMNEEQYRIYISIRTIQHGNLGAYYLVKKDYKNALKYHKISLQERRDVLHNEELVAIAYKNIATDFFYIAESSKQHYYTNEYHSNHVQWSEYADNLFLSFKYHKQALKIHTKISMETDLNIVVCINRMLGSGARLLNMNKTDMNRFISLYGKTINGIVIDFLEECKKVSDYFKVNMPVTDEINNCIENAAMFLSIIEYHKLSDKRIIDILSDIFVTFEDNVYYKERLRTYRTRLCAIQS